ncbi:MAG: phenylalanine--tRNA ligase beta subunit-related protein [Anaerolineae bacterium]
MAHFQYHPDILKAFPQLVGGAIVAHGLRNGPSSDALKAAYFSEQQAVISRVGNTSPSEIPSLAAWRGAFRTFGVDPTQYRSAGESLLRRLTKKGDIPSINMLVDIGNLVSIRYHLPVAVLDLDRLQGGITVHFADGSETFTDLNTNESEHPAAGEVIFTDAAKTVHARRWCWRQSDQCAARDDTTNALITVEAHHADGEHDIRAALADLLALMQQYAGGEYESAVLGKERAGI